MELIEQMPGLWEAVKEQAFSASASTVVGLWAASSARQPLNERNVGNEYWAALLPSGAARRSSARDYRRVWKDKPRQPDDVFPVVLNWWPDTGLPVPGDECLEAVCF